MDHTAQAIQLFVVLVLLIGAYFGVMVWTRRVNNRPPGEGGGGGGIFGGGGGAGSAGGGLSSSDDVEGMGIPAKSGADRNKGRFQLKGRDAEIAAKVLKRMLKQDPEFRPDEKGDQ
jgi:hypothetical protein